MVQPQMKRFFNVFATLGLIIGSASAVAVVNVGNATTVRASSTPTPLLWLDAANSTSYTGSGTTWSDLSPNGRNGTIVGGVTYNAQDQTFVFPGGTNGNGGYVSLSGNLDSFPSGITIEFEGEFGGVRSNWERIFDFAAGVGSTANAFWVGQFDGFNELAIEVWSNGTQLGYCYTTTNQTALGTAGDRSLNKWLITIDGTAPHNCRIYKNGVEIATRVSTYAAANFSPTGANLTGSAFALPPTESRPSNFLGRSNFVADNDFEGSIRYIRIYDQSLTAQEAVQNTSSTVTFLPNGGTGTMASQSGLLSAALTLNTFTRSGFSFSGWNTDQNGNGTPYIDGETYSFGSNVTLYAQWTQGPTTTIAATTTVANVAPTTTAPTVGSVSENDATTSDDTLPVSGIRPESLLGWVAVLMMLGVGLLLSPARRRLD
jgi:uncharacterized repeat protein (TIGR02543 family)